MGASAAASTIRVVTSAAATASLDPRKEWAKSLSRNAGFRRDCRRRWPAAVAVFSVITSANRSMDPDPGIDDHIQQIHDQVDDQENCRDENKVSGHYGNISVLHRLEKHQSHSRPLE